MKILKIEINICQACLNGLGKECHTPSCAFYMQDVRPPIDKGLYTVLEEYYDKTV